MIADYCTIFARYTGCGIKSLQNNTKRYKAQWKLAIRATYNQCIYYV